VSVSWYMYILFHKQVTGRVPETYVEKPEIKADGAARYTSLEADAHEAEEEKVMGARLVVMHAALSTT
jgi:hypothetical protein